MVSPYDYLMHTRTPSRTASVSQFVVGQRFARRNARYAPFAVALITAALTGCGGGNTSGPDPVVPTEPITLGVGNLRIASVQITQAIQNAEGTLPLVRGTAAVANVLIGHTRPSATRFPVVLRLFRGSTLVRADTANSGTFLNDAPILSGPSAQFLIPDSLITNDVSWQVEIDPGQTRPDSIRSDNRFPRAGTTALTVATLPQFRMRFVPIILSNHDNRTGNVTESNLDQYLLTARQILPIGRITATVGTPLTSAANFGSPPSGGAATFWRQVLAELDVARILSAEPDVYWYGAVAPPAGFNNVSVGGFGYIPTDPRATGPSTRTALSVHVNWFNNPTQARDLVAHELGHTFGRSHAPSCGAEPPTDPSFPNPQGTINAIGHDVGSWAAGLTALASVQNVGVGDVMGYCFPVWISEYTWRGVFQWRTNAAPVVSNIRKQPGVLIAGSIDETGQVTLRPALSADVVIPAPATSGDVSIAVTSGSGAVLAETRVQSTAVDHAAGERHFIAILPADRAVGAAKVVASTRNNATAALSVMAGDPVVSARVLSGGRTEFRNDLGRAMLLRDGATGDVLSVAWTGRIVLTHTGPVTASVSNGLRSTTRTITYR
jgi:hypothetical protein